MERNAINKEVDISDLKGVEENLLKLEKLFIREIKEISNIEKGGLSKITHFIMSITDRAISLNRAFLTLTAINNYQTAICLIRLQIDNCLRLFAYSIANNSLEFYDTVLEGNHIRNLVDRDNKKMTDEYLVTKLDTLFPGIKLLYKNTSGYIHFSKSHFLLNNKIDVVSDEKLKLQTKIGDIDRLKIYEQVDFAFNMFFASKSLLALISSYRIDLNHHEYKGSH
jgi:hypothetical protein